MTYAQKLFWESVTRLTFTELRDIAELIYDQWHERDCEDDALNFAEAISEYALQQLDIL